MSEKNKNIITIVIGIIVLIGFIIYLVINNSRPKDYTRVNDASKFFTVEGCVNKFVNAASNNNYGDLLKLLDKDYIKKNKISEDNVIGVINLSDYSSFNAKKMYEENLDKTFVKYYIYGLLKRDLMDAYDSGIDYYIIVTVNKKNYTFTLVPYDGNIFKENA